MKFNGSRIADLFAVLSVLMVSPSWAGELTGRVSAVHDGDTFSVTDGNDVSHKVQIGHIDCPEFDQPYGKEATAFARELLLNKEVTVQYEDIDRYSRYLGEVVTVGDKNVAAELLKSGMAWWYRKYSKDQRLAALEAAAKKSKQGLWSAANPKPPWQWRAENAKKNKKK